MRTAYYLLLTAAALTAPIAASAQSATSVAATSNLYYPTGGGTAAPTIAVTGGQRLTFGVTGTISYNGGGNYNNADGYGSASNLNVSGANGLSGISVFQAGGLLGVFVNAATVSGTAPAGLTYADAASIGFAQANPLLGQVFFIGDGLTGNGTGASQLFFAPTGATSLLLGFADAGGYNGAPGSYGDNVGAFAVTYAITNPATPTGVPEPATWATMIAGFGLVGGSLRRRRAVRVAFA